MKRILLFLLLIPFTSLAREQRNINLDYKAAFDSLKTLIAANKPQSFKKAVFITENTYFHHSLSYDSLDIAIHQLSRLAKAWAKTHHIDNYSAPDSQQMVLNRGVFQVIKDTVKVQMHGRLIEFMPFEYNFEDYNGKQYWSNTFVSMLLATHKGNCHSLPFLYKILGDELGAKCWLAFAPNHMYVKNYSVKDGWFNTELTSGEFPIDAWLTTTGYISIQAIQNGLYCDTLSNQQAIALCVLDLAKCYEKQTGIYDDGFLIECCDLVLQYHHSNIQAMLLRAETLKRMYQSETKINSRVNATTYSEMEAQYLELYKLGYREMPDKMYKEWLASLKTQHDKYSNQQLVR